MRMAGEQLFMKRLNLTSSTSSSLLEAMDGSGSDSCVNSVGSEWIIALLFRFLHTAVIAAFVTKHTDWGRKFMVLWYVRAMVRPGWRWWWCMRWRRCRTDDCSDSV